MSTTKAFHRVEEHPPWDPRCEFNQLRRQCLDFKVSLPRQHTLTPQNTQAHMSLKTSTPYMLIHTVYLLSQIMLHREYVPFIPIRCPKPEGPLDPPLFPPDKYDVPPGFWEESARECFKAARDIMDLVRNCQEWSALVETPIVGFAIYTVAFVGVYCHHFPWMDPSGYMCTQPISAANQRSDGSKAGESKGFEAARKSLEMVGKMRTKLYMADGWFKTIKRMHKYFKRMKSDYRKNVATLESNNASESDGSALSTRHLSLREGGAGGGLDEFKLLERTLKDFGNLEDQDIEMEDVDRRPGSRAFDAMYDDSSAVSTVKSEEAENRPGAPSDPRRSDHGPWNAINAVPGAVSNRQENMLTPSSGQFRGYEPYPQSNAAPPQQHNYAQQINNFRPAYTQGTPNGHVAPPSLTSPASRTASTPSQTSPPLDRQHQPYSGWTRQHASYPIQPPQGAYTNGMPYPQEHVPPIQGASVYATQPQQAQQQMQAPVQMQETQQPWNPMGKEAWLKSLDTRLGGDDFAAFVDGGDMAEWATLAASRGYSGGWLSAVWSGASGG